LVFFFKFIEVQKGREGVDVENSQNSVELVGSSFYLCFLFLATITKEAMSTKIHSKGVVPTWIFETLNDINFGR